MASAQTISMASTFLSQVVMDLDIEHIDNILANETQVCVTVRSCRLKRPDNTIASALTNHADTYIDNMMCPPPPSQSRISNRIIDDLIIPAPSWGEYVGLYALVVCLLASW